MIQRIISSIKIIVIISILGLFAFHNVEAQVLDYECTILPEINGDPNQPLIDVGEKANVSVKIRSKVPIRDANIVNDDLAFVYRQKNASSDEVQISNITDFSTEDDTFLEHQITAEFRINSFGDYEISLQRKNGNERVLLASEIGGGICSTEFSVGATINNDKVFPGVCDDGKYTGPFGNGIVENRFTCRLGVAFEGQWGEISTPNCNDGYVRVCDQNLLNQVYTEANTDTKNFCLPCIRDEDAAIIDLASDTAIAFLNDLGEEELPGYGGVVKLDDVLNKIFGVEYLDPKEMQRCGRDIVCDRNIDPKDVKFFKVPPGDVKVSTLVRTTPYGSTILRSDVSNTYNLSFDTGDKRIFLFRDRGEEYILEELISFDDVFNIQPEKVNVETPYTNSNLGIQACAGSIDCVNCISRIALTENADSLEETEPFENFNQAANIFANEPQKIIYTNNVYTALGCWDTTQGGTVVRILQIGLAISGGLIAIRIAQALRLLLSAGVSPDKKGEAYDILTAAIAALLLLVLGAIGYRFIAQNVFNVLSPGTIDVVTSTPTP